MNMEYMSIKPGSILLQSGKFDYAILTIVIHVLGSLLFTGLGIYSYQLLTAH